MSMRYLFLKDLTANCNLFIFIGFIDFIVFIILWISIITKGIIKLLAFYIQIKFEELKSKYG